MSLRRAGRLRSSSCLSAMAEPNGCLALGLVMTSSRTREQGHQVVLIRTLLAAGATATSRAIDTALAHRELEAVRALDHPLTASIAAASGRADDLRRLLTTATAAEVQTAFALAAINGH